MQVKMIDSLKEVESQLYHHYIAANGTVWYVPANEYAAEGVHMVVPGTNCYGGRAVKFNLINGEVHEVKCAWRMRNASSLYATTGVDVRNTYWTRISLRFLEAENIIISREKHLMPGGYYRYLDLLPKFWEEHPEIESAICTVESRPCTLQGLVRRNYSEVKLLKSHLQFTLKGSEKAQNWMNQKERLNAQVLEELRTKEKRCEALEAQVNDLLGDVVRQAEKDINAQQHERKWYERTL
jgi:hypothetical protein